MKLLNVRRMGEAVQGVELRGDPTIHLEPIHFRVLFPGGDVDVVRTSDNQYWIHVRVNHPDDSTGPLMERAFGKIVDGRQDVIGKNASECHPGELDNPDLYHLAVRIARRER